MDMEKKKLKRLDRVVQQDSTKIGINNHNASSSLLTTMSLKWFEKVHYCPFNFHVMENHMNDYL